MTIRTNKIHLIKVDCEKEAKKLILKTKLSPSKNKKGDIIEGTRTKLVVDNLKEEEEDQKDQELETYHTLK